MQFAPRELRVKAGTKVRLIFDNPDLMMHNLVLLARGAEEEVGALADKIAADPNGMAKGYVPTSPKVLHATPLVAPNGKAELTFDAPNEPGAYPYICTFPGHWRVMRGVLIVEDPLPQDTRKNGAANSVKKIPKKEKLKQRIPGATKAQDAKK
jgi:uncharacterized protein